MFEIWRAYPICEDDCTCSESQISAVIHCRCTESWALHPPWTRHTRFCCIRSAKRQTGVPQGYVASGPARHREGGGDLSADGGSPSVKYLAMFCGRRYKVPLDLPTSLTQ